MRLLLAFRCFFLVLFAGRLPVDAQKLLPPSPKPEPEPPKLPPKPEPAKPDPVAGALQLLGLLQREGRLVDFLKEEIDGFSDAQIGAAARDVHRGCKKVLAENISVEPVLTDAENSRVRVDPGFDPARIRVVGNVVGEPPWQGTLRHHGWRAANVRLPASAADPSVVAPAEVEL
jgi:hypothetical protein